MTYAALNQRDLFVRRRNCNLYLSIFFGFPLEIHIQRTEGCDHMTCTQCNTNFCYRCGERYRHLRFELITGDLN